MNKISEILQEPKQAQEFKTFKDKRKFLSGISKGIKMLVDEGIFDTVNEGLLEIYAEDLPEGTEFKSFMQWKREGKQVRKGEKAYLLWGKPKKALAKGAEEGEEFKFFPLAYAFSSCQVDDAE